MSNIVLLFACLVIGMVLHRIGKLPDDAPATINGIIIHVSLPALILGSLHGMDMQLGLVEVAAMPWLLFGIGAVLFWGLGKLLGLSRPTTGALIMLGGLGNTSFIGLPMIESYYGTAYLPTGILIDQFGITASSARRASSSPASTRMPSPRAGRSPGGSRASRRCSPRCSRSR